MKILALDLATHLGFAVGDERGVEGHGSYHLPKTGENIGKFLSEYRRWFEGAIDAYDPDEVVFEMPILPATTNLATCRKLYSMCGLTELLAIEYGKINSREANLMDIRRHFIGVARAPASVPKADRRAWVKDRTVSECRNRGFRPIDDNDADALALFSYVMCTHDPFFVLLGNEIPRNVSREAVAA